MFPKSKKSSIRMTGAFRRGAALRCKGARMTYPFETMLPADIERRSFEMIAQELDAQGVRLDEEPT